MSTNEVIGGVRTNVQGAVVNSNNVPLTAAQIRALPDAIRKSVSKSKPKPKSKLSGPGTFIKDSD